MNSAQVIELFRREKNMPRKASGKDPNALDIDGGNDDTTFVFELTMQALTVLIANFKSFNFEDCITILKLSPSNRKEKIDFLQARKFFDAALLYLENFSIVKKEEMAIYDSGAVYVVKSI